MQENDNHIDLSTPWAHSADSIIEYLDVDFKNGLSTSEILRRRKRFGRNLLREIKKKSAWLILFEQFKSLIIWLLVAAGAVSFAFGEFVEGLAIAIVIIINAAIGFFTELKAVRSMDALRKMGRVTAVVRRDGEHVVIPADEIVVGDIVIFEGGDVVSADIRLIEASKLQANESALTGESLPVSKDTKPVDSTAILSERSNMIYKGTSITRGSGAGIVVAAGMSTELGKISELVEQAEDESTPLEKRLDTLGHKLIWVTLGITTVVAILGIVRGKEVFLMIESGIALAVAAIPEGLPIVATIALARGMIRMARKNALINRLASVETLGATDIICSDKTGTLTENKMTATKLVIDEGELTIRRENGETVFQHNGDRIDHKNNKLIMHALTVGVLCNNATLTGNDGAGIGDPMEVALLEIGSHAGIDRDELLKSMPEAREEAFDPEIKMMATIHESREEYSVAVKGAPEAVLNCCSTILTPDGKKEFASSDVEVWNRVNEEMARNGTRMLALAEKKSSDSNAQPYEDLTFLGLIGLKDPPRIDVQESIRLCARAGINVVMVTGDQPATALNIAKSIRLVDMDYDRVVVSNQLKSIEHMTGEDRLDILNTKIFSRVSPKQKLDLIEVHQTSGSIVAMTGDGVNDAPALKKADIGIAMGRRGTQVAREAADMILKDDAFSSIVEAVKQGRIIFDNIRKFVLYLLSCNVSEIMIVGVASIANTPLPILPLQILFLNLVTDVFPALALGVGGGDPQIMSRPPRKSNEPIITKGHWLQIGLYGALLTASVLSAFLIALYWLNMDTAHSVTISFLTLAFGQLVHVFNMRDQQSGIFKNEITRNGWIWAAIVLCLFLIFAVLLITPAANVLKLTFPNADGWTLIVIFSLIPLIIGQTFKLLVSK